jgi:UDP-N-acetylmuramate dehydrogenase
LKIQQNISLKKYNTFGINATAKRFVVVNSLQDLKSLITNKKDIGYSIKNIKTIVKKL